MLINPQRSVLIVLKTIVSTLVENQEIDRCIFFTMVDSFGEGQWSTIYVWLPLWPCSRALTSSVSAWALWKMALVNLKKLCSRRTNFYARTGNIALVQKKSATRSTYQADPVTREYSNLIVHKFSCF
jgi:hypothetical protein